jgi:hypothetical protein
VSPPAQGLEKPIGFNVSWHTDIPKGGSQEWSMPGTLLTNLFVPLTNCHEVYFGTVTQAWNQAFEHEFQYFIDLLNQYEPWYETNGQVYWVNIQAVFPQGWAQEGAHHGWGWKTTPLPNRWNDASVVSAESQPPWAPGVYPPQHPFEGQFCDLAFALTTDEPGPGTNGWNQPIQITTIGPDDKTATHRRVDSVGDAGAGVQVLQASTNLAASNWVDVATEPLPLPAPFTNRWTDAIPTPTAKVYRVIQR